MTHAQAFRCRLAFALGAARGVLDKNPDERVQELNRELVDLLPSVSAACDVVEAAATLAQHWFDQDGFCADVVDRLALTVAIFNGRNAPLPNYGPDAVRCVFCGKYGDESTLDPVSGDGWGCGPCVDGYQRGKP